MIIIGEKINATRKSVSQAIEKRDAAAIAAIAREQDEAGADVIDVNAGSGKGAVSATIDDMKWLVDIVQNVTKKPLAVDSENPVLLQAGLEAVTGPTPWINSVSAESARLETVLPLTKKYSCPVIALCMDDSGIPVDTNSRLNAASRIYEAAKNLGIAPEQLFFDPLIMPIGAEQNAGRIAIETVQELKKRLPGSKTVVGLSNISFGLPRREVLNYAFLTLLMGTGLDAALLDPTNRDLMMVLKAADAILGNDEFCTGYIKQHRKTINTIGRKNGAL